MDRDQLIAAMREVAAEKPQAVTIGKWGTVHIRSLTVGEVEAQIAETSDKKDKHALARGAARLLCDETGKRLFDPDNAADVELLSMQPWKLLRELLDASDAQIKGDVGGN